MAEFSDILLNKVVVPLLIGVGSGVVIALKGYAEEGSWLNWAGVVPWNIVLAIAVVWLVAILIYRRYKAVRASRVRPLIYSIPHGWKEIGMIAYSGVLWTVKVATDIMGEPTSRIETDAPPRCPNCKTELDESRRFFGGWIWDCPRESCDFKKKSRRSYYGVVDLAEKVAKREVERSREPPMEKQSGS